MNKYFIKKTVSAIVAAAFCVAAFTACSSSVAESSSQEEQHTLPSTIEEGDINLGYGIVAGNISAYTGAYVEDATNEVVDGVLMMIVTNTGDKALQYADILIPLGDTSAKFSITTLLPGKSAVLLEQTRMQYSEQADYSVALMENTAFFQEEPSLMEDTFKIQLVDGAANVTNISDEDINGEVVIYYKNSSSDLYYGGITYRSRITGGIPKGEIRQVTGSHLTANGTEIVFVTVI